MWYGYKIGECCFNIVESSSEIMPEFMGSKNSQNAQRIGEPHIKIGQLKGITIHPGNAGKGGRKKCENE